MAGPIEDRHREYAKELLCAVGPSVDYLGPLDRPTLATVLGDATALLMPLEWDEPFGLVVVESLSTGTPVIAWRRGAMPEIVEDGETGFLVHDVASATRAVGLFGWIAREGCARDARARFSGARMATSYADVYERVA